MNSRDPLVVLQSFPDPRPTTNPYLVMLRDALSAQPGVRVLTFSRRRALFGRYDVVHLHWPEILVSGRGRLRTAARQVFAALLVLRWRITRVAIVRTMHNLVRQHPLSWTQRMLLDEMDRLTVMHIALNETTPLPDGTGVTILHGHYREWFARHPMPEAVSGRYGYFGLIRRYKRVDQLIEAFRGTPADRTLRVEGRASDDGIAQLVTDLASSDDRVALRLHHVDDAELVHVIGESELIVLPYAEMHNSGSALLALSLGRPVLVPDNAVTRLLSEEVGAGWVHLFDGDITTERLESALAAVRSMPKGAEPDLSARGWGEAGAAHAETYRRAISMRRGASGRVYSR